MPDATYDIAVIGAGPGGYVAAIRAAQLGYSVACIDEFEAGAGKASLGGTCLNVGCIPSKALLESSENYHRALHEFAAHGVKLKGVELDLAAMMARKDKIVSDLTGGVAFLLKKHKIASVYGHGKLRGRKDGRYDIEVARKGEREQLSATHVILATGSVPRALPLVPFDNEVILDNAGALALAQLPKRLGVIGAGVIGLEMGSVWKRLGAEVAVLEALTEFLPAADEQVAKEAHKIFTHKQGLQIRLGAKISAVKKDKAGVQVTFSDAAGDQMLECDKLIVAIGRAPNTTDLGLESVGVKTDARGFIEVDHDCRTQAQNLYAIGDVVRGPMLAHKASEEGAMVAELIAGQKPHVNLNTVPWVIYTMPEIAWVGATEQALKASGKEYRVGRFPFAPNGRAKALGAAEGFVKMLADAHTDALLGVHIIGPYASELISEAVTAMEFGAASEDIARIVHAHPSLSEVMHEAALAVDKRALHI